MVGNVEYLPEFGNMGSLVLYVYVYLLKNEFGASLYMPTSVPVLDINIGTRPDWLIWGIGLGAW